MKTLIKYLCIHVMLVLLLAGCKSSEIAEESSEQSIELYTIEELLGDWKLIRRDYIENKQSLTRFHEVEAKGLNSEYDPLVTYGSDSILRPIPDDYLSAKDIYMHIDKDSLSWLNYPLAIYSTYAHALDSNKIKIEDDDDPMHIWMSANRKRLKLSYLEYTGLYITETYARTDFNDSTLDLLLEHKFNYPLLAGKWELIRESVNEISEEYTLEFPYAIPDRLELTREELVTAMLTDNSIYMLTNGVKKKYFIRYEADYFEHYYLYLTPDSWYTGDDPYIHFVAVDVLLTKQSDKP